MANGGDQLILSSQTQTQSVFQAKRCVRDIIDDKILILDTKDQERFTFDYVAGERVTQDEIFKILGRPIVDYCIQGYNSTIFAYGQTGSGKTHTIQGQNSQDDLKNICQSDSKNDQRGILPR